MTRSCKESSNTPWTAAFLAKLALRSHLKYCCYALALENQTFLRLAAEAKELQGKLADREKADATAKNTSKGRGKKLATAADKLIFALKAELAGATYAYVGLSDTLAKSETDAAKVKVVLES